MALGLTIQKQRKGRYSLILERQDVGGGSNTCAGKRFLITTLDGSSVQRPDNSCSVVFRIGTGI